MGNDSRSVCHELGIDEFYLDILQKEAMKQDIEAKAMFKEIEEKGFISLYINFETGKSAIKPESEKIINEIATLLKENPNLKVSIEGHTDNTGTAAGNKTLSESRAKAVLKGVTAKGIDASQMSAKGWGQEKPVADNNSEEGKAKNRRVEIVKM
jgi:outer membrane protein OmpA-like peptidoglycan-associated protein